jgi:hypothetical protein
MRTIAGLVCRISKAAVVIMIIWEDHGLFSSIYLISVSVCPPGRNVYLNTSQGPKTAC